MPQKVVHSSGAVEWVDTADEKQVKDTYKNKKKPSDLNDNDIKELVLLIARKLNLIP